MSVFGDRLKKLRVETQEVVAEKIGIEAQSLGRYENGKRNPDIYIAVKLAEYYGVSVDYLLGRTELKSPDEDDINIHHHTGLTDGALITILQAKNTQEKENGVPALDALNSLLSNGDFSDIILDFALIKALQSSFKVDCTEEELQIYEWEKDRLELSIIRHLEKLRRSMIEDLTGLKYE